ncbi:MAG: hypothetical protein NT080_02790 [Spirochaetes bacterium]|nr:hypothetical protein [Spirochaetota bacterium]
MRTTLSLLLAFLVSAPLSANIAAPAAPPEELGDLFLPSIESNPLRIDRETLTFDLREAASHRAEALAVYSITNPTDAPVAMDFLFITRDAASIVASVDGSVVPSVESEIAGKYIPWNDGANSPRNERPFPGSRFSVSFEAGQTRTVSVAFRMTGGYDNTAIPFGPEAPAAAHFLNQVKDGEWVRWYQYDLFASTSFDGGFGTLELTVRIPRGTDLGANVDLEEVASGDADMRVFAASFEGIPRPMLDMKVLHREDYNIVGLTLKSGVAFPFDGRGIYWNNQLLFDLCLSNNQLSVGVEGNPFAPYLHGMLFYTWFPPGRTGYGYGGWFDVRAGGGLELDFLRDYAVGFELYLGLRMGSLAMEPSWEIFLPDPDGIMAQELSFNFVFGL